MSVVSNYSKLAATFMAVFTLVFIGWILVFQDSSAQDLAKYQMMSGLERLEFYSDGDDVTDGINIALPKGVTEGEITLTNDYVNKIVTLQIPRTASNFLYRNPITGSSKNIKNIMAGDNAGTLMVEIELDQVRECQVTYEKNLMNIQFVEPKKLYDKVVVIDAGHGGDDPGAVSGDIYEMDICLDIAKYLKEYLEAEGIRVYMTRTTDVNPWFAERVGLANSVEADAFISIHINSANYGDRSLCGTQVLYREDDDTGRSKALAGILIDSVTRSFNSDSLRTAARNDLYIVRNSQVPVALVEVGFISNEEEAEKLTNPKDQKNAARGIYQGIMEAYGKGILNE